MLSPIFRQNSSNTIKPIVQYIQKNMTFIVYCVKCVYFLTKSLIVHNAQISNYTIVQNHLTNQYF